MQIEVLNLGKRFGKEWIFKDLNFNFQSQQAYAITGPNGSGKSTLIQVIAGIIPASKGEINYSLNSNLLSVNKLHEQLAYVGPYQELIEEFTLKELFQFHFSLKKPSEKINFKDFSEFVYLSEHANKPLKNYSSGMKQRVKLGLAYFSAGSLIILDEPTVNLDQKGIDWYIENFGKRNTTKTTLICSNQSYEYEFASKVININDYKP